MTDFLYYLLKVSGAFAIFYLLYRLMLSKHTFHTVNRVYLLAIIPLSFIIPFLEISFIGQVPITNDTFPTFYDEFGFFNQETIPTPANKGLVWNFGMLASVVYVLGLVISLFKVLLNALKLRRIVGQSAVAKHDNYSLVFADVPMVFSSFRWIFIPIKQKDTMDNSIIEHEKLHGKAGHTLDLILCELFKVLLWFNPFVYLFYKDLKSVHEFQVDAGLLNSNVRKSDYLQLILNNLVSVHKAVGPYNYFNGLTIKKRVKMITKNKSSKWQLLRYILIAPIIALMSMSFSGQSDNGDKIPGISPIKVGEYDRISSYYGMRIHPIYKIKKMHTGIDFAAKKGTSIIATANGIVTLVKSDVRGYGNRVLIDHGGGYVTMYAQMSEFAVAEGEHVKQGQVIGYVGSSGTSTGPHLHYEVRKDGERLNPQDFIPE